MPDEPSILVLQQNPTETRNLTTDMDVIDTDSVPTETLAKTKPTAVLTLDQVKEIDDLLRDPAWTQVKIAARYKVNKKTIARINSGETWSDVTGRRRADPELERKALCGSGSSPVAPAAALLPVPSEFLTFLDEVVAVKNEFCLSFETGMIWGWFDWADGKHAVAGDGHIIFESEQLVSFAQRLSASGVEGYPVNCNECSEIPTFELQDFMTRPIGQRFSIDLDFGGVVRMSTPGGNTVYLRQKYLTLAVKYRMEIREAGSGNQKWVYLTQARSKSASDTSSIVIAAAATMEDPNSEISL